MNRDDLISEYAALVVDGMDMETLYMYAIDKIRDDLKTYSDADLESEVREYYPHLLGDDDE
jgi:hypothetical protein